MANMEAHVRIYLSEQRLIEKPLGMAARQRSPSTLATSGVTEGFPVLEHIKMAMMVPKLKRHAATSFIQPRS